MRIFQIPFTISEYRISQWKENFSGQKFWCEIYTFSFYSILLNRISYRTEKFLYNCWQLWAQSVPKVRHRPTQCQCQASHRFLRNDPFKPSHCLVIAVEQNFFLFTAVYYYWSEIKNILHLNAKLNTTQCVAIELDCQSSISFFLLCMILRCEWFFPMQTVGNWQVIAFCGKFNVSDAKPCQAQCCQITIFNKSDQNQNQTCRFQRSRAEQLKKERH